MNNTVAEVTVYQQVTQEQKERIQQEAKSYIQD